MQEHSGDYSSEDDLAGSLIPDDEIEQDYQPSERGNDHFSV